MGGEEGEEREGKGKKERTVYEPMAFLHLALPTTLACTASLSTSQWAGMSLLIVTAAIPNSLQTNVSRAAVHCVYR